MPHAESNSQGHTLDNADAHAAPACAPADSADALAAAVEALRSETTRLTALSEALERSEEQWEQRHWQLEAIAERTERSRRKLAARLWRLRRQKIQWLAQVSADANASASQEVEEELQMLRGQLAEAAEMLESLRDGRYRDESARCGDQAEDELTDELASLRGELHSLLSDAPAGDAGALAELREELKAERIRCEELESQNASLAALLASSRVQDQISGGANTASLESLSWEERKAAILYQLNREDHEDSIDEAERESLREAVARADREIQRRDNEIAELRQLLESQSTTLGGSVAVGAAAIAEMIEADELVREEREKLQAIKEEWQEKLRKAEIDLSLERAKLARERRELEQKHAELEDQLAMAAAQAPGTTNPEQPRRRRWLTQLGLSETEGD